MVVFYSIVVIAIVAVIAVQLYWIYMVNRERKFLEEEMADDQITMFDVRQLLMEGEKEMAVKVYSDLFDVSEEQAQKDVEELERSMNL